MSSYALSSSPTGASWKRIDLSNGSIAAQGPTTPMSDTPPTAPHQWQYQFGPGTPFSVNVDQIQDGPHQVFYNVASDSTGTVDATQLQSIRRGTQSFAANTASDVVRRPIARFSGPSVDQTHVYVRYRASTLQSGARSADDVERAEGTGGKRLPSLSADPLRVVDVPAGVSATAFANRLRSHAEVLDVSAVHTRHLLTRPPFTMTNPDTHFKLPDQWYLFADGFPNAWSYDMGTKATIAVIDTGIDLNNTDLTANLTFKEKILSGARTNTPQDMNGHGTNTAGIAAAASNNGLGFAGAGFGVKLMSFGIFNDAGTSALTSDEALAIADAVTNGADVISLSLGAAQESIGDGYDQGEVDAVNAALAANVTVVAAAGNNADGGEGGGPHTTLDYPAAYPGVIAVGATGLTNTASVYGGEHVTTYSQYGPSLAVVAPGGDPSSPTSNDADPLHWIWNYDTTTNSDPTLQCHHPVPATSCTAFFAGTSQATPQVAAAAALLVSASGGHGHTTLTPAQIAQIIQNTADNINDPHQGHGRLNVYRALASLIGDTAAYSGPIPTAHGAAQLIAFAYNNHGGTAPTILDYDFPAGVPVAANGTFRIADVRPADATTFSVGVWYDGNGDGHIDVGDWIGVSTATCSVSSVCTIGTVTLAPVTAGYHLP